MGKKSFKRRLQKTSTKFAMHIRNSSGDLTLFLKQYGYQTMDPVSEITFVVSSYALL